MKIKLKIKPIFLILIVAAVAAGLTFFIMQETRRNGKHIKVSGTIEGDNVRLSFRVSGQITELLTDEGKVIKTGDILARLNTDELSKTVAEDEAALRADEYQYALDQADYVRAESLHKAGAISTQQRDMAKTKADSSRANTEHARASLDLAKTRLGFTDLISQLNGFVLVKSGLVGEVVQPGAPIFTAVDLNNIWVTAYINEKDLGRVKLGQDAFVQTDTYPNKRYKAWVSFISSETEFTPKYIQTSEERVKYVYRIKVRVDNSSLELKPGMPADAYITKE
jgi:HlyD family secretion protein